MRSFQTISDFSTGEISPLSEGRIDTIQYRSACRKLENFIVSSRGGVRRREGMHYVCGTKDGDAGAGLGQPARLMPFIFSRDQSYILELGDKYMRFYTDRSMIMEDSSSPLAIVNKFGERLRTPSISEDAAAFADPEVQYEITTPWDASEIWDIHTAQANDVMILVHENHKPQRLSRYGPTDWRLEDAPLEGASWDDNTGYPRTTVFYNQRLWFGGTPAHPQKLWGSRTADFYEFTIPDEPAPDDPLELLLGSYTQEKIEWLSSERVLLIGTSGSEQRLSPDVYIGADNAPQMSRMSSYGSRHIQPVYIGGLTIFVQGSGRQVRSYTQSTRSTIERFESKDLAWFAEHITEGGVIATTYELIPDSVLWLIRGDGVLVSMTHDPSVDQDDFSNLGWARHPTDGHTISVQTIPEESSDITWLVSHRNGRYVVEFLDRDTYTDGCLTTDPESTVTIDKVGNLGHLEGKGVQVVVDGAVQNVKNVSGGEITLDTPGVQVEVGLPYESILVTTPYNDTNPSDVQAGTKQRWSKTWVKIVDSAKPMVNGERVAERFPATPMGSPAELVTGEFDTYNLGIDEYGSIEVTQDLPKPTQLVALYGVYQSEQG